MVDIQDEDVALAYSRYEQITISSWVLLQMVNIG